METQHILAFNSTQSYITRHKIITAIYSLILLLLCSFWQNANASWVASNTGLPSSNIATLAIDPITPSTLYAGTWGDGIFKSTDAGANWSSINTGLSSLHMQAMVIDPTTPSTLYVGSYSGGVSKSIDGGINWSDSNTGLTNLNVRDLVFDPTNSDTLYAGTYNSGVFKSIDAGANWTTVNTGLTNLYAFTLAIDPITPSTLYVGTYLGGVFKSIDGGTNWNISNTGLGHLNIRSLAIDPGTPDTIYVATQGGGLYKSTNGANNWSGNFQAVETIYTVIIDPTTPSTIYVGTYLNGMYRTTDGGTNWSSFISGFGIKDTPSIAIDPVSPNTLYAGTNDGSGVYKFFPALPSSFIFTDVTDIELNTLTTSVTRFISGITIDVDISVTNGEYSINGNAFTSEPGIASDFDLLQLRTTSSSEYNTAIDTVLTVGDGEYTWSVTTLTDTVPDVFSFIDKPNKAINTLVYSFTIPITGLGASSPVSITGGEYSINGGIYTADAGLINNNDTVAVRVNSSSSGLTGVDVTLTIGGVSDTFTVTTVAEDTTPNQFSYYDRTNASLNRVYNSTNSIQISGINVDAAISITDGEYSIDGGAWTSASGTVSNLSLILLRQTSSTAHSTTVDTVLTIGGVSATFSTTTKAFVADTVPSQFSYYDRTNAQLNTLYNSTNSIQVSGINADAAISITGGEYSIDGGAWTSAPGTVSNLSRVLLRQTSASTGTTQVDTVLTIGDVNATFSVTTKAVPAPDTTPNQFSYYDRTDAQLNRLYNSTNSIQVSGITADAPISVTGGEYSIDGGAWTSAPGTVSVLSRVLLRQTSAVTNNTQTDTVLTIGGISATFSITTKP